ncbi:MAG: hypothetical protein D6B25_20335 [Desulfobulbaceae bacterium]|nr:MAG: hypothetical protein D6B25_20335 [Desulfobulbaceae bacterium]
MTNEIETIDLHVLVSYAVKQKKESAALQVVEQYQFHPPATRVLRHYYEQLPEAREEMACELRVVAQNQGVYLFALKAETWVYLYVSAPEDTFYIGEFDVVIEDSELLQFFGYESIKDYLKRRPSSFDALPPFDVQSEHQTKCVICGAEEGAFHLLGCPVEVCPWCDAQLNQCNCRFDQLGVDEFGSEDLLEQFEQRLEQKGRIPFTRGQGPSYPVAGTDTVPLKGTD